MAKLKSAAEVARRSGRENTREMRVPPNEIIDTPEQNLYTVALSSNESDDDSLIGFCRITTST